MTDEQDEAFAEAFLVTPIREIKVPLRDAFEPMIHLREVPGATPSELKILATLSVIEQCGRWSMDRIVEINENQRREQQALACIWRAVKEIRQEQKERHWRNRLVKWPAMTVLAGLIAAGARRVIEKWWP